MTSELAISGRPRACILAYLVGLVAISDGKHLVELSWHCLGAQHFERDNVSIAAASVADVNEVNDGQTVAGVEVRCWGTRNPDQALHAKALSADGDFDLCRV